MKGKVKNIIRKYLSNSCTPEELDFLKKYLKSNDLSEFEQMIKEDWSSNHKQTFHEKEDEIWLKLKMIIANQENDNSVKRSVVKRNKKNSAFLKYAAVFVGIIISTLVFYTNRDTSLQQDADQITLELNDGTKKVIRPAQIKFELTNTNGKLIAQQKDNKLIYNNLKENLSDENLTFNTLNVPYGKKFQVILSDGSEVYLNSGSSLKYPVKFIKGAAREVYLEGEGYFNIMKDENDSFIVNANNISTKVFGTQFNISSYDNEEYLKVVLVEGSVAVYDPINTTDPNYLAPNQMASYLKSTKKISTYQVDISSHIAWVDGVLLFKNEKFSNIIRKLERHYSIKIVNNYNKLNDEKFTGRFEIEDIDNVLTTFKKIIDFNYIIDKNEIIIKP